MYVEIDVLEFRKLFIMNVKTNNESSRKVKSAVAIITNLIQHELKTYVGWILKLIHSEYQVLCSVILK